MKRLLYVFLLSLVTALPAIANNIVVTNVTTVTTGAVVQVQFDISWENSWRTSSTANWDGAWVFLKFKDNDGTWKHLNFTGSNVFVPAGYTSSFPANNSEAGVGMFIYRSANGFGNVSLSNVKAGITSYPGIYDIKAFAIEMVYVPQGSFYIGDFFNGNGYSVGNAATPFQVTGVGSTITLGTGAANLKDGLDPTATATLTNFPTGFNAFWMMKYELSQAGYINFLNSLTYSQQITRFGAATPPNSTANTQIITSANLNGRIKIITPGISNSSPAVVGCDYDNDNIYNEATDGEWNVISYLNWGDAAAYLDWAGVRPMTDMEYEKTCRGSLYPNSQEFAWGTDQIANYAYTEINAGQNNSAISNSSSIEGNAIYNNTYNSERGLRNGIFGTAFSTRQSSGAGYYGVMELTGNLYEFSVTTACVAGRSYRGIHGNGTLNAAGDADEDYWPGINGNSSLTTANLFYINSFGVTQQAGIAEKGGALNSPISQIYLSYRVTPIGTMNPKTFAHGIRGVRDAN